MLNLPGLAGGEDGRDLDLGRAVRRAEIEDHEIGREHRERRWIGRDARDPPGRAADRLLGAGVGAKIRPSASHQQSPVAASAAIAERLRMRTSMTPARSAVAGRSPAHEAAFSDGGHSQQVVRRRRPSSTSVTYIRALTKGRWRSGRSPVRYLKRMVRNWSGSIP